MIYSLQFCVDYIYKLNLHLINTTLIYKYNIHIIVENKEIYIIILVCNPDKMTIYSTAAVMGLTSNIFFIINC